MTRAGFDFEAVAKTPPDAFARPLGTARTVFGAIWIFPSVLQALGAA